MAFYCSFYPPLVLLFPRVNSCVYCLVSIVPRLFSPLVFTQSYFPDVFMLLLLIALQCILQGLADTEALLSLDLYTPLYVCCFMKITHSVSPQSPYIII